MKVSLVFLIVSSCLAISQARLSNASVGDGCQVCIDIAQILKQAIEEGLNTENIDKAATHVCSIIKIIPEGVCIPVVEALIKHGLDLLDKEEPKDVCKILHLC